MLRELGAVPVLLRALRRGAWGDDSEVPHTLLQIIVNVITLCAAQGPSSGLTCITAELKLLVATKFGTITVGPAHSIPLFMLPSECSGIHPAGSCQR